MRVHGAQPQLERLVGPHVAEHHATLQSRAGITAALIPALFVGGTGAEQFYSRKGISGGERKRVMIGTELLFCPQVRRRRTALFFRVCCRAVCMTEAPSSVPSRPDTSSCQGGCEQVQ